MHPSLVALLLLGAVLLTIKLERDRGVVEPYKVRELENQIESLKSSEKIYREMYESYRDKVKDQEEEIEALKTKIEDEYKRGYKEGSETESERLKFKRSTVFLDGYYRGFKNGRNEAIIEANDHEDEM